MSTARHVWRHGMLGALCLAAMLLAACGSATPTVAPTAQSAAPAAATATTAGATTGATAGTPAATPTSAPAAAATSTASRASTTPTAAAASASPAASPAAQSAPPISANATRFAIAPNDSKATYHVNETLVGRGFNVAVGSTGTIAGDLYLDRTRPSASSIGTITVDISKLASDSSQRDNQIRRNFLESTKYPTATFVPKRLEGLPDTPYTDGQTLTFKIVGDLTVRTVTKEVTFDATGKLTGDTFSGTATTQFNMTDFGFQPPDIAGVVKAENGVILDLTIVAKQRP